MGVDVLFIVKRGQVSGGYCSSPMWSSGLKNSAQFVVDMLNEAGISSVLEEATDANCIDKFVHRYHPKVVVLEAIWCPPSKLRELSILHPRVKRWIVRIHSEISFLAMEGMAIDWINRYEEIPRTSIAANSQRTSEDLWWVLYEPVDWLPNYYSPETSEREHCHRDRKEINIGCFGAMRPLKNQLIQAIAAIRYAYGKELFFHVNAGRIEQGGQSVLKNMRALFADQDHATLVEHPWLPHEDFLELLASMDLSMAVSLTESFNIVTADAVMCGVPVVVSKEIQWVAPRLQADPTSTDSIVQCMKRSLGIGESYFRWDNRSRLQHFNRESQRQWVSTLKPLIK